MTQERSCGSCTKCCEGWAYGNIYGQELKPGTPCRFVEAGSGCSIYKNRPVEPCVVFKCAWLEDPEVPDWVKPERSGLICSIDPKMPAGSKPTHLSVLAAGGVITDEYRDWAKMYASKKGLIYLESGVK